MQKVSVRGGFSDRNKIEPLNTEIQYKNFDERTRKLILNEILTMYRFIYNYCNCNEYHADIQRFFNFVFSQVYTIPCDGSMIFYEQFKDIIEETILYDKYDAILTLIEMIIRYWERTIDDYIQIFASRGIRKNSMFNFMNDLFKKEFVGYRFVGDIIVEITDENEITSISESLNNSNDVVKSHFQKSLSLLSDRMMPDYENSIKESISAVEAMCEVITGIRGKEATLGSMLKKLEENGVVIHGGLKSAFNVLYGYTSDANGIRHAGDIGGPNSTFEEAKFMLVSCSAFVNYLTGLTATKK